MHLSSIIDYLVKKAPNLNSPRPCNLKKVVAMNEHREVATCAHIDTESFPSLPLGFGRVPSLPPFSPPRTFNWALTMGGKVPVAEGLENGDLSDGTGEFLDAWLMLVEKMVNPTTVLESPHSLPANLPGSQSHPQFSALRFLVVTQKVSDSYAEGFLSTLASNDEFVTGTGHLSCFIHFLQDTDWCE